MDMYALYEPFFQFFTDPTKEECIKVARTILGVDAVLFQKGSIFTSWAARPRYIKNMGIESGIGTGDKSDMNINNYN